MKKLLKKSFITVVVFAAIVAAICPGKNCKGAVTVGAGAVTGQPAVTAKAAFLIEANSGKVLFTKDENRRLPIASMVKIATLGVIYEALESGQIKLTDMVMVSRNASGMGGSQAFLDFDSEYSVEELMKSIFIASANDSCVAMAELICGSESDFVVKMNELASRVGATNTNFTNCTGLPAPENYSCAADIAKIYVHNMKSPFYGLHHSIWMYDLVHPSGRVTGLTNTNKHARFFSGCQGGKTGFTSEAGHCITVTAARGNLKPVAVIVGASDSKTRFAESAALMNYVFDSFENKLIVGREKPVATVQVRGAMTDEIEVFAAENYFDLVKKGDKNKPTINIEVAESVKAPVTATQAIGKIIVTDQGNVLKEIDIITGKDVEGLTYWGAVKKIIANHKI